MASNPSRQIRICLQFMAFVAVFAVLKITRTMCMPLVLSVLIFLLMLPLINRLEKARWPSILIVFFCLLILIVVILLLLTFITIAVQQFIDKFPSYELRFAVVGNSIKDFIVQRLGESTAMIVLDYFQIPWFGIISGWIGSISSVMISLAKGAVMMVLLTAFLLLEKRSIMSKVLAFSHSHEQDLLIQSFLEKTNLQLANYTNRKLLISIISGVFFYCFAKLAKQDFPMICAVFAMAINFIPTIGPILAVVMAFLVSVLQFFPNWNPIMIMVIPCILTEITLVNIIGRQAKTQYLNLSSFFILLSLLFWEYIWGIAGLFLAVPIMSFVQMVLANIDRTRPIALAMSSMRRVS